MSDAIRCGQCRWWNRERSGGTCELNPPVYMQGWEWLWGQPQPDESDGCSRGEPKTSNLTVSDGVPVAMVDGLPVFQAKLTEDAT